MPRNYYSQGVQNAYQGSRVGENIGKGKLPSHYEMMTDFAWDNSNLEAIADVRRNVVGEKFMFTQVLAPQVFRQNLIDGIGTWSYSIVKDNSFTLNRMGFRYMNELIPYGTWEWVSQNLGYQAEYFSKAAQALVDDEYEHTFNLLTSILPESEITLTDEPNLKSTLIDEVSALEAKTGIPRNNFTLSLSRDALDMFNKEELVAQNLFAGHDAEAEAMVGRNPWSVGNIVELPRGGHDANVLYMIHVKSLCKVVVFAPQVQPGFYSLNERDGSPMNKRFVASDGFTVDYFDAEAGVKMSKSTYYQGMPEINFISSNKALEIPVGATVNLNYLKNHYGLEGREAVLNKNELGADITSDIIVTPSFADTSAEGIGSISLSLTSPTTGLTTVDTVIVFLKDGAVPPTQQVTMRTQVRELEAEKKALAEETKEKKAKK